MEVAINDFIKSITYKPFSVITSSPEEKRNLFNMFEDKNIEKKIYVKNDMVYIYIVNSSEVYGISLRDVGYIGKDITKFLAKVYSFPNSEIVTLKSLSDVVSNIMFRLKNYNYAIPCLLCNSD